jgi:V-type H+-transporting ATPase proteolipid subunit
MSGIIAVYSLVISVLIADDLDPYKTYTLFSYVDVPLYQNREVITSTNRGVLHLASGLAVGLTGLAAGYCIGVVGDAGVRAFMDQPKVYTGIVLILIFAEVLGLYG